MHSEGNNTRGARKGDVHVREKKRRTDVVHGRKKERARTTCAAKKGERTDDVHLRLLWVNSVQEVYKV